MFMDDMDAANMLETANEISSHVTDLSWAD